MKCVSCSDPSISSPTSRSWTRSASDSWASATGRCGAPPRSALFDHATRMRIAILMSTPPSYDAPAMVSFDPVVWVPRVSPASLFIQLGKQDTWITHDAGESLIAAAKAPKKLVWYDAGHGLDSNAYSDRITWLTSVLARP